MGFNKTVILPILAVLNMLLQVVFGVQIPEEIINEVAEVIINAVSVGVIIYGIFKNHKQDDSKGDTAI